MILERETRAVIFTDLHMPTLDGWALRRAQRESLRLAHIPFIVISADFDVEEHGRTLEATAVLAKPVALESVSRYAERYDTER